MHQKNSIAAGEELHAESKVLILLHGRGGSAEDMLSFSSRLEVDNFALIAPQATNNTWYPYSFLAPPAQNEPWLSSALGLVKELVDDVTGKGVTTERVYFCGFSQGACLALEFIARNANRYGGVAAFTGGLIGDKIYTGNYKGDFKGTPFFMGTSNPDRHVPIERFHASANILRDMNAAVTEKVYNNMGHIINQDEIENANRIVFNPSPVK
ncbi:MAG: alpha/beta hydrolase [Ginsengibacter sp.]